MPAAIDRLAKIAKPIVQSYHADLTTHDAAMLDRMKPGDVAYWSCNPCGTHMVRLDGYDDDAPDLVRKRREYLDAVQEIHGRDWYLIQKRRDGNDLVQKTTYDAARESFNRQERITPRDA